MFFDFGVGEVFGLALLAIILVGPERLPNLAADAAKLVKKIKTLSQTATSELRQNFPQLPEQFSLPIGAFYGANTV